MRGTAIVCLLIWWTFEGGLVLSKCQFTHGDFAARSLKVRKGLAPYIRCSNRILPNFSQAKLRNQKLHIHIQRSAKRLVHGYEKFLLPLA